MDPKVLNLAAKRARGPSGLSAGQKQGITWNEVYKWLPRDLGEKLVAQVFFLVDDDLLDWKDHAKLNEIGDNLGEMVAQEHKVTIRCIGRADVSYKAVYNMGLAERRAKEVADYLKAKIADYLKKNTPGLAPPDVDHSGTGEVHSRSEKSLWLEDRRVDVIAHVEPQYTYKFQYWCNNQNELRQHIFKTYYPRYWLWRNRGLDYLIEQYENEHKPGGSGWVKIRPRDYGKALEIVEMLADFGDWQNIKSWVESRDRVQQITTAYEVEYRKAYRIAYDRASLDFRRSDFRKSCEFFAVRFGFVPKNTPYAKRPAGSRPSGLGEKYKYEGNTRHTKR